MIILLSIGSLRILWFKVEIHWELAEEAIAIKEKETASPMNQEH